MYLSDANMPTAAGHDRLLDRRWAAGRALRKGIGNMAPGERGANIAIVVVPGGRHTRAGQALVGRQKRRRRAMLHRGVVPAVNVGRHRPGHQTSAVVDASSSDGILLPTTATTITTTTTTKPSGAKRRAVRRTLSRILSSGARASARRARSSYLLDDDESIFVGVSPPAVSRGPAMLGLSLLLGGCIDARHVLTVLGTTCTSSASRRGVVPNDGRPRRRRRRRQRRRVIVILATLSSTCHTSHRGGTFPT